MQGRQNAANSERKGPHKSMHCKFCKPPGVVTPEKPSRSQLETKTKIHLVHEAADLRLCDIRDEAGVPDADAEACVCILEGENSCPKCVPDKKRAVLKKKTCRCPKGAKPNPNVNDGTTPKKKKPKEIDDEYWWEKYSREHDAIAQETWKAYLAQRKKDKKLARCQKREQEKLAAEKDKGSPIWFQKLSCQQMIYVEFLSTAIRLDSDENITDRTFFILGGLGLYPRPKPKILKKCLRYCHYNSVRFLNQLHIHLKEEDFFNEKKTFSSIIAMTKAYTWNERLIMNAICHLEFPMFLRELIERLPDLPREQILPRLPYKVFSKASKREKYENAYDEPVWKEQVNWVEKSKIDRINRCRGHMDTKRVKIPFLALVKRPSLIDARPFFLAQIEANEQTSRRMQKQEGKKLIRKHNVSTFNSSVDVTAIAGIEDSEISTTDKADTEEICVFLRGPLREQASAEEDELGPEKDVRISQEEPETVAAQIDRFKPVSEPGDYCEIEFDDIPFKTPPKTESGLTIEQRCVPPKSSPGPPATHYDVAKRELDVINEELCRFHPFVSVASAQIVRPENDSDENSVTLQLMSAAEKLKVYAQVDSNEKDDTNYKSKIGMSRKKQKCKRKKNEKAIFKRRLKRKKNLRNSKLTKKRLGEDMTETFLEGQENMNEEFLGEEDMPLDFMKTVKREKKVSQKQSIISDPDPEAEYEWSLKKPCIPDTREIFRKPIKRRRRKKSSGKKEGRRNSKRNHKREEEKNVESFGRNEGKSVQLYQQAAEENIREKLENATGVGEESMTECHTNHNGYSYGTSAEGQRTNDQGNVELLLNTIIKDLSEEGYISASYPGIARHPDVDQLMQYLRGEILTQKKIRNLHALTKIKWATMTEVSKFSVPDLGITNTRAKLATWKDKGWISRLSKAKKDEFFFKIACARAEYGRQIYKTLSQNYVGASRYLKIFYAYMLSKYEDAILRGIL